MHTKGVTRPEGDHIPYAVAGAIVHCSYGTQLGRLKLPLCHGVYTKDKALMNVNDYEPFQNVMPFGYCTSSLNPAVANGRIDILGVRKAPCVPVLTKEWLNGKEDKIVDGYAALTKESTNMCLYCGMIKILDDGQNLAPVFSEGVDVGECKVPGKEEEEGSDSNAFLEFLYGAGDAALTDTTLGIIVNEPQTDHPIARKTGEIVGHTATTVVGAVETILAGVGLGGSVAISATGVAAPVGVPAAVAAAAGVAYGSSVTVQGAKNIGSSASDLYSMIKGGGKKAPGSSIKNVENVPGWFNKGGAKNYAYGEKGFKPGKTHPPKNDGTIITDVMDKTGKIKVGEIHKNQPVNNGSGGKYYPEHFHYYNNVKEMTRRGHYY